MKSITSFFSKRTVKNAQRDFLDSEDDGIVAASKKKIQAASGKRRRSALTEANIGQAQNKRRRIASHVEVPPPPPEFASNKSVPQSSPRQPLGRGARRNDSDHEYDSDHGPLGQIANDEGDPSDRLLSSHSTANASRVGQRGSWCDLAAASGFSLQDKAAAGARHPRKASNRRSYALAEEASEDESDERAGCSTVPAKSRRKGDEDSDFEEEHHVEVASDDDDFDIDASDESSASASEPEPSDEEPAKPKKAKKIADPSTSIQGKPSVQKASTDDMRRMLTRPQGVVKGLDPTLPPLHDINDIFADITARAVQMGLQEAIAHLKARPLRVATMCSGTESPILALQMVADSLKKMGLACFEVEHVFSAEIVPFKQAYIERNFAPPVTFRNIVEFMDAFKNNDPKATTAYGAKVPIPMDVDIVVAGTSCVDYSALNNSKKGIRDNGESGLTWHGALAYCKEARPAIIIFENVCSADWASMLKHYREIGYECKGVLVDTKDYYIPQTRQRGYMVCFDVSGKKAKNMKASTLGSQWQGLMEDFRRLSSSPISSFLIPSDQVVRRLQARDDDTVREVDWTKCEIRHMKYRTDERLGNARPFTRWTESGTVATPDNSNPAWYRRQVERVLDTIDCSILRKAIVGYDARYKTRIWDLSQNIDRSTDHQKFGIAGCITPDGIVFISDAGRAMSAEETLKLQGIPLDRISFTTETSNDQQDLAGNAMTSTVVGSALLAALITGHDLVDTGTTTAVSSKSARVDQLKADCLQDDSEAQLLEKTMYHSTSQSDLAVNAIQDSARRAARRCYCEGNFGLINKPLQICVDCGHTTHVSCGGNPRHNYVPLQQARLLPTEFEEELRAMLPLHLSLEGDIDRGDIQALVEGTGCSAIGRKEYMSAVQKAFSQDFSLSKVRRTYCWTASYVSQHARLDLVIGNDQAETISLEWQLHAIAPSHLASNDWVRAQLQQPLAKAAVRDSLLDVEWLWRLPVKRHVPITLEGQGAMLPTWWARNSMPDYREDRQPEQLEISVSASDDDLQQISGTYRSLPKCGKACDSLYKKITQGFDEKSLWLFLDPSRTDDPDQDEFVFSHNKELLEYDEVRPVIARIKAPWRPWPTSKHPHPRHAANTSLAVDAIWEPAFPGVRLEARRKRLELAVAQPASLQSNFTNLECSAAQLLVKCEVGMGEILLKPTHMGDNRALDTRFLSDNAWVFEVFRRHLRFREWHAIPLARQDSKCDSCAPAKPPLRWRLVNDVLQPYEDPGSAAVYEQAVKSRPAPFVLQVRQAKARETRPDTALLQFGVNIASLAHLVLARLPVETRGKAEVVWRLDTVGTNTALSTYPVFELRDTRGIEPYAGKLDMTVKLFPKQRLSLAWMVAQEDGIRFTLEEAEEAKLAVLRWRVEARGTASITVRGGICADHPGFGKTITSLALIQAQFLSSAPSSVRRDLQARASGLIASSATLIICPHTLRGQWSEEIKEKLRWSDGVLVIDRAGDLDKFTVHQLETARIIVVNRSIFSKEEYAERLAVFAGIPSPAKTKSGRAFSHWLQYAHQEVPKHVRLMRDSPTIQDFKLQIKAKYAERVQSDEFRAAVPSRRLRGQNVGKQKSTTTMPAAPPVLDTKGIEKPLLEMYYFNRIIVDEFHEYEPREYAAILELKADKRWGLSATPAIDDFYDISRTAAMIGVPLRYGCDAKGIMKAKNRRTLQTDMTPFELFDSMREMPSKAMHDRLWELDQAFLDTFVRRNVMEFGEMAYSDHLVPVSLEPAHKTLYSELSQHLNSLDMRIRKGRKKDATVRDTRIHKAMASAETAEDALTRTAAFYAHDKRENDPIAALSLESSQDLSRLTQILSRNLLDAAAKEPDALVSWINTRLDDGTLGDAEAIDAVHRLISHLPTRERDSLKKAVEKRQTPKYSAKTDGPGKTAFVTELSTTASRFVTATRSLRYIQHVQDVQRTTSRKASICQHQQCDRQEAEIGVSAFCGHSICRNCHSRLLKQDDNHCPAQGCKAEMSPHHLLWEGKIGDLGKTECTPYGAKIEAAMDLLEEISGKGDQAILFVQYAEQLDEVAQALEDRDIPATVVKDTRTAGAQISKFRTSTDSTVIVLNASDETAAGSNLQNANHVLFLSPLLRDTQYAYESTMAQAVGRVRRYGQKKQIFVYRFVALDTIDVDILEHREKRVDALVERGASAVKPAMSTENRDQNGSKAERTQLVKEDGRFSLRPRSWLVGVGSDESKMMNKSRVSGWEDFSSLVKFSRVYTEDDD